MRFVHAVFWAECELTILQEEHPPIVPNFGMGSILVNYYRKKDEKDDYMPRVGFD